MKVHVSGSPGDPDWLPRRPREPFWLLQFYLCKVTSHRYETKSTVSETLRLHFAQQLGPSRRGGGFIRDGGAFLRFGHESFLLHYSVPLYIKSNPMYQIVWWHFGRGHYFCLQKSRMSMARLVYFYFKRWSGNNVLSILSTFFSRVHVLHV